LIPTAILGTQSSIELSEDEHQLLKSFRAIGDRKVKRNLVQFLDSVVTQTILSQKADQTN
jgi:hypothetical protein